MTGRRVTVIAAVVAVGMACITASTSRPVHDVSQASGRILVEKSPLLLELKIGDEVVFRDRAGRTYRKRVVRIGNERIGIAPDDG